MRWFAGTVLVVAGVVHLLPVVGVTGAGALSRLYAVDVGGDVALLLRHRAALFGIVGTVLLAGAFVPALTTLALLVGLASTVSFLVLAGVPPRVGPALRRVAVVDAPLALGLVVALGWRLTAAG